MTQEPSPEELADALVGVQRLLRLVVERRPGIRITDAADELHLAGDSVSTLANRLARQSCLACTGLAYAFGATNAVDGLDLTVREGEGFGLLGPNGAAAAPGPSAPRPSSGKGSACAGVPRAPPPPTRRPRRRTSSATSPAADSTRVQETSAMSEAPAAPHAASADRAGADGIDLLLRPPAPRAGWRLLPARVVAMCAVELQKPRHDRTELHTRAVLPALWLLIFGQTFTRLRAIPSDGVPYIDYLAPGIIAHCAMFIAIFYFYGIQIIWERDAGILDKLPGWLQALSKANPLSGGHRSASSRPPRCSAGRLADLGRRT